MNVVLEWVMGSPSSQAGAIDVVAVRKPDGSISCSPFHVKVAKASKKGEKKIVQLKVNGKVVDLSMKVGPAGEAFFVERARALSRRETPAPLQEGVLRMTTIDSNDPFSPREGTEEPFSPLPVDVMMPSRASKDDLYTNATEIKNFEKHPVDTEPTLPPSPGSSGALRSSSGSPDVRTRLRLRSYSESDLMEARARSAASSKASIETAGHQGAVNASQSEKVSAVLRGEQRDTTSDNDCSVGRRARAASDMSELINISAQRAGRHEADATAVDTVPGQASEGVEAAAEGRGDAVAPLDTSGVTSLADDHATATEAPGGAPAAEDAADVSWMWRWGTLPVKKKSKASAGDLHRHHHKHNHNHHQKQKEGEADEGKRGEEQHNEQSATTAGSGIQHPAQPRLDSRGRAVSLPVLYNSCHDDGAGSVGERSRTTGLRHRRSQQHRQSHSSALTQLITGAETEIPAVAVYEKQQPQGAGVRGPDTEDAVRAVLVGDATATEYAEMFQAACSDTSTFHALSLCGHLLTAGATDSSDAGDAGGRPPLSAEEAWGVIQRHLVSPRDFAEQSDLLRRPELVVVLGDCLLPLRAAERVLVGHTSSSSGSGSSSGWKDKVASALAAVREESGGSLPIWAGRRISRWNSINHGSSTGTHNDDATAAVDSGGVGSPPAEHPADEPAPHFRYPSWQESFSDLFQAYRVQTISSMHHSAGNSGSSGSLQGGQGQLATSLLLQGLVFAPDGEYLESYGELWQRQQQQHLQQEQLSVDGWSPFTALLALDAGGSTSLYKQKDHRWTHSLSRSTDSGYGVGYALHAESRSEADAGSQHSMPALASLRPVPQDGDHREGHLSGDTGLPGHEHPEHTTPIVAGPAPPATAGPVLHQATSPPSSSSAAVYGYMRDATPRQAYSMHEDREGDGDGGESSQPSVYEEGDTDNDNISLQDIDLEDISPEPAGGDFYDSDTDSYLSLSLEEGEGGGGLLAGGSSSSGKFAFAAGGSGRHGGAEGAALPEGGGLLLRRRFRRYRYRKVLVPSQEQLELLDLRDGPNDMVFEVEGCAPLRCCLFVWPADAKVVVTDLEGVFCRGKQPDNRSSGVWISFLGGGSYYSSANSKTEYDSCIRLFAGLRRQGYRVIYLAQGAQSSGPSASPLLSSQEYLASFTATTGECLPPGPVFKSPDSLVRAFGAARTEVFRASALRGVKSLFPSSHNPFHACFCGRESAAIPFSRFGFPEGRIFLVSDKGEVRSANRTCVLSFARLCELLDQVFPFVKDSAYSTAPPRRPVSVGRAPTAGALTTAVDGGRGETAGGDASIGTAAVDNNSSSSGKRAGQTAVAGAPSLPSPLPTATAAAWAVATTASVATTAAPSAVQPPPLPPRTVRFSGTADDTFSDFNYWKIPPAIIEDEY